MAHVTRPQLPQSEVTHELPPGSHDEIGFELGWDYAHHGLTPPVEHLFVTSALRQGWESGRATFGQRTLRSGRHTALWLQLRCHAWMRGRSFETTLLTPNYLQQIEAEHCPITRQRLDDTNRSMDRVRDDAGFAAGNLVQMSQQANQAKGQHDHQSVKSLLEGIANGPIKTIGGLDAAAWQRVATLLSFVTELPHEEAARQALHLMPPNRLHLFNPIQALQALVTRQLATQGWSQRLARLEALLPSEPVKTAFNRFVMALVPRVLDRKQLTEPQQIRCALEDAWGDALVQKRWLQFALMIDAAQAERLVHKAAAKQLSPQLVQHHEHAMQGWAIEHKGFRALSAPTQLALPLRTTAVALSECDQPGSPTERRSTLPI